MTRDITQYNLRIPRHLKESLEETATKNETSLNAEINQRLLISFQFEEEVNRRAMSIVRPILLASESSLRKLEIKERLFHVLDELKQTPRYSEINPSKIAYLLGYEIAGEVIDWFAGKSEMPFADLYKLASYFNINSDWLMFNEGSFVKPQHYQIQENFSADLEWLLSPTASNKSVHDSKLIKVTFLRYADTSGSLVIVKEYENGCAELFHTQYNLITTLSDSEIKQVQYLCQLNEALVKVRHERKISVMSHALNDRLTRYLSSNNHHPLNILKGIGTYNMFMDDLSFSSLDDDQMTHWSGFAEIYFRVHRNYPPASNYAEAVDRIINAVLYKDKP